MTARQARLLKPHFIDQLISWIDHTALPTWAFYVLYFLAVGLIFTIVAWLIRFSSPGTFVAGYFILGTWFVEFLIIHHFLVHSAESALQEFKPLIRRNSEAYEDILYEFTHLPSGRANLWLLLGASIGIGVISYALGTLTLGISIPDSFIRLTSVVGFGFFSTAAYRAIHQLGMVRRLLADIPNLNLYDLSSLYALSLFPAKIVFLTVIFIWINPAVLIFPDMFRDQTFLEFWVFITLFPAFAIYPTLSGVRQRLIAEKDALLRENGQHLEEASKTLYERMKAGQFQGLSDFEKGVSALMAFRKEIESVSTWPWKVETMRWLATATILPLVLWLIQFIVQRFIAQ